MTMRTLLFGLIFFLPPALKPWLLRRFCRARIGKRVSIGWFASVMAREMVSTLRGRPYQALLARRSTVAASAASSCTTSTSFCVDTSGWSSSSLSRIATSGRLNRCLTS